MSEPRGLGRALSWSELSVRDAEPHAPAAAAADSAAVPDIAAKVPPALAPDVLVRFLFIRSFFCLPCIP